MFKQDLGLRIQVASWAGDSGQFATGPRACKPGPAAGTGKPAKAPASFRARRHTWPRWRSGRRVSPASLTLGWRLRAPAAIDLQTVDEEKQELGKTRPRNWDGDGWRFPYWIYWMIWVARSTSCRQFTIATSKRHPSSRVVWLFFYHIAITVLHGVTMCGS